MLVFASDRYRSSYETFVLHRKASLFQVNILGDAGRRKTGMDKQTIGFDRELSLPWLDLTAGLAQAGYDLSLIRTKLLSQLAAEIPGAEACRKTVTLLTRLWVRIPTEYQALQTEALALLPVILPEERLWLHWGMALLAYPFFHDVASMVGQLLRLQAEFESVQVRQRIRERWGQRTTLDRAINRAVQTFTDWHVIIPSGSESRIYYAAPFRQTGNSALALWFMACAIQGIGQASARYDQHLPLSQLIQSPAIFPFDLTPHLAMLRRSERFQISHQGLNLEMIALV
jgi:hypothetical protein